MKPILVLMLLLSGACGERGVRWPVAVVTEDAQGTNSVICMAKDCTVLCGSFEVGGAKCAYAEEVLE